LSLVATPLEPIFTALHADADERRLAKAFLRVTRLMLWITTPLLVPLLVFREEIMRLYLGPAFAEYESTPAVMGLLLLTFPFFAVLNPIFLLARGKGQIGHFTRWIVLGQFLNVFLTIMLVGPLRMGAIGSALATLLVAALYPVLIWPTGCRLAQVPYTQYIMDIGAGVIPGILAAGIALASRLILAFDTWPILAAAAVITPCMGWLLTIPWLRAADRRDIAAVVARVYTRRRRGLQVVSHFTRAQPERDGSGEIADRPQNDR
jgi:O-antigen/teichoic acid export membrane protein